MLAEKQNTLNQFMLRKCVKMCSSLTIFYLYLFTVLSEEYKVGISQKLVNSSSTDENSKQPYFDASNFNFTNINIEITTNITVKSIDFSYNPITEIKNVSNLPDSIEEFRMTHTDLHIIHPDTLKKFKNMNKLYLDENPHFGHFYGLGDLQSLQELHASFCGFTELPANNLNNLIYLNFSSNLITTISSNSFLDNINLTTIDLSGNKISTIDEYAFIKNGKLEYLNLSSNRLHLIDFTMTLKSVLILSISQNYIENVDILMLLNAILVDISYNKIRDLPEELGRLLPEVKVLNANGNPLTEIKRIKSSTLQDLLLDGCKIEFIEENAFDEAPNLHTLILSDNKLINLSFLHHLNVTVLSLRKNPLSCDCPFEMPFDVWCPSGNKSWRDKCAEIPSKDYSQWFGEVTTMPLIWAPILAGILGFVISFIAFKCHLKRTRKRKYLERSIEEFEPDEKGSYHIISGLRLKEVHRERQ